MSAHDDRARGDSVQGDSARGDALAATIEAERAALADLAAQLHAEPEVGFEERASAGRIAAFLRERGVEVEVGAFGLETALRATAGSDDGPHFAILAEYDALPGLGHACGHNLIAAIGVGAFLAARAVVDRTGGRVSLIGTPAEESGGGKQLIIDRGGFDGIGAAGMVHPGPGDGVSPLSGSTSSGVRRVEARYRGVAAHAAAAPHLGRNALDGVVLGYQAIAQLRQHIRPDERIHGIITDGGAAPNIVPERAAALYYVRAPDVEGLRSLTDRVVQALRGSALATGTEADIIVDPVPPYLPLRDSVALTARWARALSRPVPAEAEVAGVAAASTDMGNVSQLIPSLHPMIGIGAPGDAMPHTAAFAAHTATPAAFDAAAEAAVGLASAAIDWLADPALRAEAQEEFDRRGPAVRGG